MTKSKQEKSWFMQHPILTITFVILILFVFGLFSTNEETVHTGKTTQKEQITTVQQEIITKETKPSLNYNADTSSIRSGLQTKGYAVLKVDFNKNPNGFYVLSVVIDTKGNYDKEVLDAFRIMHKNGVADYYLVGISDYEYQAVWSFTATKKTLDDFFSGRITETEYIKQVETERLI